MIQSNKEGKTKETALKGVSFEEIADGLTATEFRKYGETSPTVVNNLKLIN